MKKAYFEGREFWSGCVSLIDGIIEEVHTYKEAEYADFPSFHVFYTRIGTKNGYGRKCILLRRRRNCHGRMQRILTSMDYSIH